MMLQLPAVILAVGLLLTRSAGAKPRVIDMPLAGGRHQRVLYAAPAQPRAVLVMLPGGDGRLGIGRDGTICHGDNFVVRTRAMWVQLGYAMLIPDSDTNLRGLRSGPHYAALVNALAGLANREAHAPVFLVGTSQGAIAAVNAASNAPPGELAGIVLTESVSRLGGSHETVFSAAPERVRVPVLIIANRDDRCKVAPPADAPRIAAALVQSPSVRVLDVSGGRNRSKQPCGSLTPHGYYGIEPEIVGDIAGWIDAVVQAAASSVG